MAQANGTPEQRATVDPTIQDLVPPESVFHANWLHDQREMMRLRRLKLGEQWGVPASLMEGISPQAPGATVVQRMEGSDGWWKSILAGLLGMGLGAAGLFAGLSLLKPDALPPPVAPSAPAPIHVPGKIEGEGAKIRVRWKLGEDGQWHVSAEPEK